MKSEENSCVCRCCKKMGIALVVALFAIIGLVITNVVLVTKNCSNNVVSTTNGDDAESYAGVVEHLAQYVMEIDMADMIKDTPTIKRVTGHGISEEDGAVYITFEYAPVTENENGITPTGGWKKAKMFFWKDKDTGQYSWAFNWLKDEQ